MENYLPTIMYIISGIMLGYTALSIYTISQHIKNQAKDIEKRFDFKNIIKNGFIATKNHFFVYEENKILKQKVKDLEIRKYNAQYIQTENE